MIAIGQDWPGRIGGVGCWRWPGRGKPLVVDADALNLLAESGCGRRTGTDAAPWRSGEIAEREQGEASRTALPPWKVSMPGLVAPCC